MFFRKRLKKATKEDYEKFAETMKENDVGFKDRLAMVLSAMLVIVLPCLLILLAFAALILIPLWLLL